MTQGSVPATLNAALALRRAGRMAEAEEIYRRVLGSDPEHPEALHGLGLVLGVARRYEEAADCLRRAGELDPDLPGVFGYLGDCHMALGRPAEAIDSYRRELALRPDNAVYFVGALGKVLADAGQSAEAVACYRRAVALDPSNAALYSNFLAGLHYDPSSDAAVIRAEHQAWAARHAAPLAGDIRPHANDRTPGRKLRVGYVSGDFRSHVVGLSILPVFEHHDRGRFELFAYSDTPVLDEITERLRSRVDHWSDSWRVAPGGGRSFRRDDATLAQQIRLDRIDVLVDLAQHTDHNRLLTFARKPAPVQIAYLGYNATTGLPTIDYRVTDAYMDPPDRPSGGPEQLLRLPNGYWTYRPAAAAASAEVAPPPFRRNGYVTFGSLNNFLKVNPGVVAAWARVLNDVPGARLLVVLPGGEGNTYARALFEQHGVAGERIRMLPPQPRERYVRLFDEVDVGLDPFPYNGGITSLDSLWMGVPFVTLAGERSVGRAGLSILTNVGLPDLVARDVDEYVALTARLARDASRLTELRGTLRDRLRRSPLMDEPQFTRDLESLYVWAWEAWCARGP